MDDDLPGGMTRVELNRPTGLPQSPNVLHTQAIIARETAVADFFTALTQLADIGKAVLEEMLKQAHDEREEQAARDAAYRARAEGSSR